MIIFAYDYLWTVVHDCLSYLYFLNKNMKQSIQFLCIEADFEVILCQISLEAVRSLGLLLEGSVCGSKAIQPIHRLLAKGPLQTQAGYSTVSRSFSLHKLLSCLQHSLTLNPFGITACLRSGKKLAWAQQGILSSGFRLYVAVCQKSEQQL